ncbi:hypothetical protein [Rhodanobacter sp. PCA2]|uniref:hypothetical protein n=1 Tax=Rhodanobacter sp. PCA2 TaxID=2006117 RepID=UPI0015E7A299|nr:hypothetical protein [Rhodanobacter sp. PCA2]
MKKPLTYAVFALVYFLLCFAAETVASDMDSLAIANSVRYAGAVVAALIALAIARRMGPVSVTGVLVAAAIGTLAILAASFGLLASLAARTDPAFHLSAGIVVFARIGGWGLALNTVASILLPAALLLMGGRGRNNTQGVTA